MALIDQHDSETKADSIPATSPHESGGDNTSLQLRLYSLTSYNFPQGLASNQSASGTGSQSTPSMTVSTKKENLKVAGRFIQTLMTKLPEIVDTNPVKMALGLAKVIIQIKKVCRCSLARSPTDNHPRA